MNNVIKFDKFLDVDSADNLFAEIYKQSLWLKHLYGDDIDNSSSLFYVYEPLYSKIEGLIALVNIVENKLISMSNDIPRVEKIWVWNQITGEEYIPWKALKSNRDLFYITFGTTRKFVSKNANDELYTSMKHGDALYIPSEVNSEDFSFCTLKNKNVRSCSIHLCMVIKRNYDFRSSLMSYMNIEELTDYLAIQELLNSYISRNQ